MAEKMTWLELRRAIAVRSGDRQKEVNSFMDELVKQIMEGLRTDKVVRISGLGSFKLQAVAARKSVNVAARKSVNVATGEDIVIPGYEKVTFVPESGVKELFLNLKETTEEKPEAATPLQKLGAQADEIVGLLADLGQAPKKVEESEAAPEVPEVVPEVPATPEIPKTPIEPEKPEPVAAPEPVVAPEPIKAPEPVAPVVPPVVAPIVAPEPAAPVVTPEPIAPIVPPVVEPIKEPEKEPVKEPEKEPEKPKYHFLRDTLITLTILLLLLAGAFYFFRQELTKWVDSLREKMQTPVEQVVEPVVTDTTTVVDIPQEPDTIATDTMTVDETAVTEQAPAEEVVTPEPAPVVQEQPAEVAQSTPEMPQYKEGDVIATVRLRKGEDLSRIARRFYGHGDLWVFIYE